MKKLGSLICGILLLVSACTLAVSANDSAIRIADNFNSLHYSGSDNDYVRVENGDGIDYDYSRQENEIFLTKRQSAEIDSIYATVDGYRDAYVVLDVWYKNGQNDRNIVYVNRERLEEYNNILNGIGDVYTTVIDYAMDVDIVMTEAQIKGEAIVCDGDELPRTNSFSVWIESADGCFSELAGEILIDEPTDEVYFLDYFQRGAQEYSTILTNVGSCEDIVLYRITDEELLAQIKQDYAAYYDNQMMPYTETVGKTLSAVMMILIFGLLPLAALVVGVVGWIRSKRRVYRRLFAILTAVSATEIIAFVAVCILCATGQ